MRTQILIFIVLLTLGVSKNYVSGKPISDISPLPLSHVTHINKRARCTREDINNDRCDSSRHTIDESSGGEESGGNEEKNGGEEKNGSEEKNKGEERNKSEGRNRKENRGGGADRQAADDGSGADRANYRKNGRKENQKNTL